MPHDFIDPDTDVPRNDSNGNSCLDVDGIMGYRDKVNTWSNCSKESIKGWFETLTLMQVNCKIRK